MHRLRITLFFSLLIISIATHAQQRISGIVTEKNTGTPVPFATVQSKNAKNTLTNESGEFEIDVPELPAGITVSHLNYEAVALKISSPAGQLKIALTPKVLTLKEVSVGNPAVVIMQEANDKAIKDTGNVNYGKAFLRQIAYDGGKPVYMNEIFFDAGWKPHALTKWRPTQSRHMQGTKGLSYDNFSFYSFILSGYLSNTLHKKPLSGRHIRVDSLYIFKLAGTYDDHGQEIAKISCTPRSFVKGLRFEGFYYVNTTTNNVLKIEGSMQGVVFHTAVIASIKNKETTFTAQYRLNKDGENVLDYSLLNTSNRLKLLGFGVQDTDLYSTLYMTDDESINKNLLEDANAKINDGNMIKAMTFNADFWKNNQGIKRTEKEQAAIEILEKIPQVNK